MSIQLWTDGAEQSLLSFCFSLDSGFPTESSSIAVEDDPDPASTTGVSTRTAPPCTVGGPVFVTTILVTSVVDTHSDYT